MYALKIWLKSADEADNIMCSLDCLSFLTFSVI